MFQVELLSSESNIFNSEESSMVDGDFSCRRLSIAGFMEVLGLRVKGEDDVGGGHKLNETEK